MQQMYDPLHDDLPYFFNHMAGSEPGNGHHESYSLSHIPGRWLNALLNAEDVLNLELRGQEVDNLAKWTYLAFSHPMGLSRSFPAQENRVADLTTLRPVPVSDMHNLRETTHALYALSKYRQDQKAYDIAKRQIETIDRYYDFECGKWDEEAFRRETGGSTNAGKPFPREFGRYIGPLVKLYRATGMREALLQAIRLKDFALQNVISANGDYDVDLFGAHTHSVTSMFSSLAQLGELLADNTILSRVKAFMENGLDRIAIETGWCIENYSRTDHLGEVNNTGDILEICLILGRAGYTQYLQRAERILRAHMLPSQLLDTGFIPEWDIPEEDYHHRLATRSRGAFGFPCPYGHEYQIDYPIDFNWDIVGGAVGSLCEAFRDKVTTKGNLISVNLHFDHSDENIEVNSPYTNNDVMEIKLRSRHLVRIRLSHWVDRTNMKITSGGKAVKVFFSGDWLYLPEIKIDSSVRIQFPMAISTTEYKFRADRFTYRWRGDCVDGAACLAPRLRFFDGI